MTTKKERAEALARMTKAELIKTVKTLDARQVKLLNRIARQVKLLNCIAEPEERAHDWRPSLDAVNTAATLPAVSPLDGKGDE